MIYIRWHWRHASPPSQILLSHTFFSPTSHPCRQYCRDFLPIPSNNAISAKSPARPQARNTSPRIAFHLSLDHCRLAALTVALHRPIRRRHESLPVFRGHAITAWPIDPRRPRPRRPPIAHCHPPIVDLKPYTIHRHRQSPHCCQIRFFAIDIHRSSTPTTPLTSLFRTTAIDSSSASCSKQKTLLH
uniref:Uncharacterized protein n=1 Tax=Oryza rufipogon TaxID=4529 RepID=A0A0E0R2C0_ORYRU